MRRHLPLAPIAALLALLVLWPATAAAEHCEPAAAAPAPRQAQAATLLFLPGPLRTPEPELTADLEQLDGFAVGLFSPTIGRYSPTQMLLDISQGSRVAGSLYTPVVAPPPGLVVDASTARKRHGHYAQWPGLVRRAEVVPGDVEPGLLACAVKASGRRVAYVAPGTAATLTGVPAADTAGRIDELVLVPEARLTRALERAQEGSDLVVGTLPSGSAGLGVVRTLAAAAPQRLIIVAQTPPDPARTRLLAIAVRGVGGEGGLSSATTRRDGLVVTTDIAPTILRRLGATTPPAMQGQPIEGVGATSSAELLEMNARLALVAGRRGVLAREVIVLGGAILLLTLLLGQLTGRRRQTAARIRRVTGLAVFWLPLLLLVAAVLRPSRASEVNLVVAGSLLLAALTDSLVRWPRAPIVPATAVVLAHAIDFLAFSGKYTGESLLGSNPLYGARFFGIGNELEAVITVSCVIGVGAALCTPRVQRPARWFVVAAVLLALFLGAGRLGADVGGVIYVGAAFGAAAFYVARIRLTPFRTLGLIVLPFIGLAAIAALDAVTGGESHLTRTVVDAGGVAELWDVAVRRTTASINGARAGGVWLAVLISLAALVWGWFARERLLAPLTSGGEDAALRRPLRAGLAGALVGTAVGALANDSGPAILIIGTIYTIMGILYVRGRPPAPDVGR